MRDQASGKPPRCNRWTLKGAESLPAHAMGLVVHLLIAPLVSRETVHLGPTRASFTQPQTNHPRGFLVVNRCIAARRADRFPSQPSSFRKDDHARSAWVALLFGVITTSLLVVSVSRLAAQKRGTKIMPMLTRTTKKCRMASMDYEAPPRRRNLCSCGRSMRSLALYPGTCAGRLAGFVLALAIVLRGGPNAGPALPFVVPIRCSLVCWDFLMASS